LLPSCNKSLDRLVNHVFSTTEFLVNGATCKTSLLSKTTFCTVLKHYTRTLHTFTTFRQLLISSSGEHNT
jgi:hypothetical protein